MQDSAVRKIIFSIVGTMMAGTAAAEPRTYEIDPTHTFPSFEADHWGGLSIWRGNIEESAGTIVYDKEAQAGTVNIEMQMASIDFGFEPMNERARVDILHVDQFPTATYNGTLAKFVDGSPTAVEGELTLHGVTKTVNLEIVKFQCQPHFRLPNEVCGADARATIMRDEFGIDYDLDQGFFSEVALRITVEGQTPLEQ